MHSANRQITRFFAFFAAAFIFASAEVQAATNVYTLLHGFGGGPGDGANPQYGPLTTDGTTFYGMTLNGGSTSNGVLFKMNVNGSGYQVLHSFTGKFAG